LWSKKNLRVSYEMKSKFVGAVKNRKERESRGLTGSQLRDKKKQTNTKRKRLRTEAKIENRSRVRDVKRRKKSGHRIITDRNAMSGAKKAG